MVTETKQDVANRLLRVFLKSPKRYVRFESAVYGMLLDMPHESYIKMSDICETGSLPLMRDIVKLFILDQPWDAGASYWELLDDFDTIHRSAECYQSVARPLPKWDPKTT